MSETFGQKLRRIIREDEEAQAVARQVKLNQQKVSHNEAIKRFVKDRYDDAVRGLEKRLESAAGDGKHEYRVASDFAMDRDIFNAVCKMLIVWCEDRGLMYSVYRQRRVNRGGELFGDFVIILA